MKNAMKILAPIILAITVAACAQGKTANEKAAKADTGATANQMNILTQAQPPIQVRYSQVRQTLIVAEYLAAEGVATHSFVMKNGNLDPIDECDSVGYPVAGTSNVTNPQQTDPLHEGNVVGQAEPTLGLFTGNTTGSWLICLTKAGKPFARWVEDEVEGGYPVGTTWDYNLHKAHIPDGAAVPATPIPLTPAG